MKFFRLVIIVMLCLFLVGSIQAQDKRSEGVRFIFHPTVGTEEWYMASWIIGNIRTELPDNLNLFVGLGRRIKNGYLELMVWKQWSEVGGQWFLDSRFQKQWKNWSLYVEASPRLDKLGFYDFVIVERRVWKNLNVGVETENIHRYGPDLFGGGPRLSGTIFQTERFKMGWAFSLQIRTDIPTARGYNATHAQFSWR